MEDFLDSPITSSSQRNQISKLTRFSKSKENLLQEKIWKNNHLKMKIDQDLFDLEDEGISSENDQEEDDFDLTHFCLIKDQRVSIYKKVF